MLDKEYRAVHRCGTLVLGVFLEKDKLLPLSPVITHYDTHIHQWGAQTRTYIFSIGKFVRVGGEGFWGAVSVLMLWEK